MRILTVGCSWTEGYGLKYDELPWPMLLGHDVDNHGTSGASNEKIYKIFSRQMRKEKYDLVIVGWSGVTRRSYGSHTIDFCYVPPNLQNRREMIFKDITTVDMMIGPTKKYEKAIRQKCLNTCTEILFFSVFDEVLTGENYLPFTFFEYLVKQDNGIGFNYRMPIFEFDWLSDKNYKLVSRFAKKNMGKDWQRAVVEREKFRPSKYFLPCGHPNAAGHREFANYIKEQMEIK